MNISIFKEPKSHTRVILKQAMKKYCYGKTVDLGAGRGKYKKIIKQYATEYISIDNGSSNYQFKKENEIGNIDLVCDLENEKIPLQNSSVDTIICTEVIEHIANPPHLFKEINRILKPNGYLILSSDWLSPYHPEPKDYWRFSPDAYKYLCQISNLKLIECNSKGGYYTMKYYLLTRKIDLQKDIIKKIFLKFSKLSRTIENILFFIDQKNKQEKNTIGHLIVAKK